jgi:hypothetical protein
VEHLERLDEEFEFADAAGAAFDFALGAGAAGDLVVDALLQVGDLEDQFVAVQRVEDEGAAHRLEGVAEPFIAGDGAGLEQGEDVF